MKVSKCCGVSGQHRMYNYPTFKAPSYEHLCLCPRCGEHCEYINEIEQLARAFSQKLRHYLSDHEMSQIISLNESEEDPCICHSHDFCDANMVMYEAFIKLFDHSCIKSKSLEDIQQLADDTSGVVGIWDKAWAMAKENKFYQ